MRDFAVVFPGQGSQKKGMLAALAGTSKTIENTFAEASEVIGQDLWDIARHDRDQTLDQTRITQPALLTAGIALWRLWRQRNGAEPAMLAGHSLGEYSALVAAEVLEFGAAVDAVHKRGMFMQQAAPQGAGGMAAIIGLDSEELEEACRKAQAAGEGAVSAANYNSPGQIVIAGDAAAVERAMRMCLEAGARRALPVKMSVPSHCDLMEPARRQLESELAALDFRTARFPVVQNVNGRASSDPGELRENLIEQICRPVRWIDCIEYMAGAGISRILECGPGKVLTGLIRRISPQISTWNCDEPESLSRAVTETA